MGVSDHCTADSVHYCSPMYRMDRIVLLHLFSRPRHCQLDKVLWSIARGIGVKLRFSKKKEERLFTKKMKLAMLAFLQ